MIKIIYILEIFKNECVHGGGGPTYKHTPYRLPKSHFALEVTWLKAVSNNRNAEIPFQIVGVGGGGKLFGVRSSTFIHRIHTYLHTYLVPC